MFIYINVLLFKKVEDLFFQVFGCWNNLFLFDYVVFFFLFVVLVFVKIRNNIWFFLLYYIGEVFFGVEEVFLSNSLICYIFK